MAQANAVAVMDEGIGIICLGRTCVMAVMAQGSVLSVMEQESYKLSINIYKLKETCRKYFNDSD